MGFSDIFKNSFLTSYTSDNISVIHITAVLLITCLIACYIFFGVPAAHQKNILFQDI